MTEYLQEAEAHLSDYIDVIKKRKSIVITFFIVAVVSVTAVSLLMTPIYRSTVTLLIDQEGSTVLTASGNVSLGSPHYFTYKEYFESQKTIIKSRPIIKQVYDEFGLKNKKKYKKAVDPINTFLKTIKVEAITDTRLLQLHVENSDPQLAADIANRIAELYVKRNLVHISRNEVVDLLKNEYLRLQTKLSEASKKYKNKHPQIIRIKEELNEMVSRIKRQKEASSDFGESGIPDDVLVGLKANNVSIQELAEPAVKPIKPKKRVNVIIAVIVGLFGGIGLAFFSDYLDDSVKTAEDVKKITAWSFLGHILHIEPTGKNKKINPDLFVHYRPKDPIAEAYRTIRTSISFLSHGDDPVKSILITSPRPKEGKSVTACNLAIALAQNNNRVLLIDADMRKPRLHKTFNLENRIGLASFLTNKVSLSETIQKTEVPNLSLCACGEHPPNPSELLASQKIKEAKNEWLKDFDFLIFDAPPVSIVTDALILSRIVDQTIIVLESEQTSMRILPRISQLLTNSRAKNVSFLINKKAPSMKRKYDYYYAAYGSDEA